VICKIRIANRRADLQAALGRVFDMVEWEAVDIEHTGGRFDVQLHQVDERRTASQEANVCALLRGFRLRRGVDRGCRIGRPDKFEGMHRGSPLALCALSNLLDCCHNIGVSPASTNVAAHEFLHGNVVWTARLVKQRYG
jgi:hypothetical protein